MAFGRADQSNASEVLCKHGKLAALHRSDLGRLCQSPVIGTLWRHSATDWPPIRMGVTHVLVSFVRDQAKLPRSPKRCFSVDKEGRVCEKGFGLFFHCK
ncbi:hypothetical protein, partial [Mesorhizobium sp.]|uniref:hypothetical protein n=1 Tax=Mesorhizobium sp. TaxID=1871066 RepID=UPI0025F3342E